MDLGLNILLLLSHSAAKRVTVKEKTQVGIPQEHLRSPRLVEGPPAGGKDSHNSMTLQYSSPRRHQSYVLSQVG